MRSMLIFLVAFVLALAAGLGGFSLYSRFNPPAATPPPTGTKSPADYQQDKLIGLHRPDFQLMGLDGKLHGIEEWDGKVVLLNFWAPWCPPCRQEIPGFVDLHRQYGERGLVIIGIGMDQADKVKAFVNNYGIEYVNLFGEPGGDQVNSAYGNRFNVLPYSVIIDRQGRITHTEARELSPDQVEKIIEPLL